MNNEEESILNKCKKIDCHLYSRLLVFFLKDTLIGHGRNIQSVGRFSVKSIRSLYPR